MQPLTPYAAFKVVNAVTTAKGIERSVTSQMMYGYAKNGRIATVGVAGSTKVYFDGDAFKLWLDKYIAGGEVGGRVDYEDLAQQYL
jgi:hypothetical protein